MNNPESSIQRAVEAYLRGDAPLAEVEDLALGVVGDEAAPRIAHVVMRIVSELDASLISEAQAKLALQRDVVRAAKVEYALTDEQAGPSEQEGRTSGQEVHIISTGRVYSSRAIWGASKAAMVRIPMSKPSAASNGGVMYVGFSDLDVEVKSGGKLAVQPDIKGVKSQRVYLDA